VDGTESEGEFGGGAGGNYNSDDYDAQQKVTTYQTPTSIHYWLLA